MPTRSHHRMACLSTLGSTEPVRVIRKGLLAKFLEMNEHGFRDAEANRSPFLPPWRCTRII